MSERPGNTALFRTSRKRRQLIDALFLDIAAKTFHDDGVDHMLLIKEIEKRIILRVQVYGRENSQVCELAERLVVICNRYAAHFLEKNDRRKSVELLNIAMELTASNWLKLRRRKFLRVMTLNSFCFLYRKLQDPYNGLQFAKKALELEIRLKNGQQLPRTYMNFAVLYSDLRDRNKSVFYFRCSLYLLLEKLFGLFYTKRSHLSGTKTLVEYEKSSNLEKEGTGQLQMGELFSVWRLRVGCVDDNKMLLRYIDELEIMCDLSSGNSSGTNPVFISNIMKCCRPPRVKTLVSILSSLCLVYHSLSLETGMLWSREKEESLNYHRKAMFVARAISWEVLRAVSAEMTAKEGAMNIFAKEEISFLDGTMATEFETDFDVTYKRSFFDDGIFIYREKEVNIEMKACPRLMLRFLPEVVSKGGEKLMEKTSSHTKTGIPEQNLLFFLNSSFPMTQWSSEVTNDNFDLSSMQEDFGKPFPPTQRLTDSLGSPILRSPKTTRIAKRVRAKRKQTPQRPKTASEIRRKPPVYEVKNPFNTYLGEEKKLEESFSIAQDCDDEFMKLYVSPKKLAEEREAKRLEERVGGKVDRLESSRFPPAYQVLGISPYVPIYDKYNMSQQETHPQREKANTSKLLRLQSPVKTISPRIGQGHLDQRVWEVLFSIKRDEQEAPDITDTLLANWDSLYDKILSPYGFRVLSYIQRFFRGAAVRARLRYEKRCAVLIQRVWRGHFVRHDLNRKHRAATVIQRSVKKLAWKERAVYLELRKAVVVFQTIRRCIIIRRWYCKLEKCCVLLQRMWRGFLVRSMVAKQRKSTVIIQAHVRGYVCRSNFLALRRAINCLKKRWKMKLCRGDFVTLFNAAQCIQRYIRMRNVMKWCSHRHDMAKMIQKLYRGHLCRRWIKLQLRESEVIQRAICRYGAKKSRRLLGSSSKIVQRFCRTWSSRNMCAKRRRKMQRKSLEEVCQLRQEYDEEVVESVVFLQTIARKNHCMRGFQLVCESVSRLQMWFRVCMSRMHIFVENENATVIQSAVRSYLETRVLRRRGKCATVLQKLVRGYIDRRNHEKMTDAVITLQKYARGYITRRKMSSMCSASKKVQRWLRETIYRPKENGMTRILKALFLGVALRCSLRNKNKSAAEIQRTCRGWLVRRLISRMNAAAECIQLGWKLHKARNECAEMKSAALTVGSWTREISARSELTRKLSCAILIQKMLRGMMAKRLISSRRDASIVISRSFRRRKEATSDTAKIQSVFRGALVRRNVSQMKRSVLDIQRVWRMHHDKEELRMKNAAALCIARWYCRLSCKPIHPIEAFSKLQNMVRSKLSMKSRFRGAVIIQSWWRGVLWRRHLTFVDLKSKKIQRVWRRHSLERKRRLGSCLGELVLKTWMGYKTRKEMKDREWAARVIQRSFGTRLKQLLRSRAVVNPIVGFLVLNAYFDVFLRRATPFCPRKVVEHHVTFADVGPDDIQLHYSESQMTCRWDAAVVIQKVFRGYHFRKLWRLLILHVSPFQRIAREHITRRFHAAYMICRFFKLYVSSRRTEELEPLSSCSDAKDIKSEEESVVKDKSDHGEKLEDEVIVTEGENTEAEESIDVDAGESDEISGQNGKEIQYDITEEKMNNEESVTDLETEVKAMTELETSNQDKGIDDNREEDRNDHVGEAEPENVTNEVTIDESAPITHEDNDEVEHSEEPTEIITDEGKIETIPLSELQQDDGQTNDSEMTVEILEDTVGDENGETVESPTREEESQDAVVLDEELIVGSPNGGNVECEEVQEERAVVPTESEKRDEVDDKKTVLPSTEGDDVQEKMSALPLFEDNEKQKVEENGEGHEFDNEKNSVASDDESIREKEQVEKNDEVHVEQNDFSKTVTEADGSESENIDREAKIDDTYFDSEDQSCGFHQRDSSDVTSSPSLLIEDYGGKLRSPNVSLRFQDEERNVSISRHGTQSRMFYRGSKSPHAAHDQSVTCRRERVGKRDRFFCSQFDETLPDDEIVRFEVDISAFEDDEEEVLYEEEEEEIQDLTTAPENDQLGMEEGNLEVEHIKSPDSKVESSDKVVSQQVDSERNVEEDIVTSSSGQYRWNEKLHDLYHTNLPSNLVKRGEKSPKRKQREHFQLYVDGNESSLFAFLRIEDGSVFYDTVGSKRGGESGSPRKSPEKHDSSDVESKEEVPGDTPYVGEYVGDALPVPKYAYPEGHGHVPGHRRPLSAHAGSRVVTFMDNKHLSPSQEQRRKLRPTSAIYRHRS